MALTCDMNQTWGDIETKTEEFCPGVKMLFAYQTRVDNQKKCDKLKNDIEDLKIVIEKKKQQLASMKHEQEHPPIGEDVESFHAQAIYEIDEDIDFYENVVDDISKEYGKLYKQLNGEQLEKLREQRAVITEQMDRLMVDQHKHYKLQKERFESCKQKYGQNHTRFFPEQDQEFISNHRAFNEACWNEWYMLSEQRAILTQEIEKIDDDDADY